MGEWWGGLSRAWRTNIALYGLAVISLVALVVQIVAGDGQRPQRVEVASRAPKAVPTTRRPPVTVGTTTTVPAPPVAPTTPAAPRPATPAPAPAPAPPGPAPLSVDPPPADEPPATIPCRNSVEPRCGAFYFDPPPGDNQPLSVSVPTPQVSGQTATFTVTVTDPDHEVLPNSNCTRIEYGDGAVVEPFGCRHIQCPDAYGPWETPVKRTGRFQFTFSHSYNPGHTYTAKFSFRTDRDGCLNPYGSEGSGQVGVMIPGP